MPDSACLYAYSAFSWLTAGKPSSLPISTSAKMTTIVGTMYAPCFATKRAVSAGHRQHLAGVEEARRAHRSVGDRLGERIVAPADVAHGGEAAVERVAEHPDRVRGAIRLPDRFDPLHRYVAAIRVHVR